MFGLVAVTSRPERSRSCSNVSPFAETLILWAQRLTVLPSTAHLSCTAHKRLWMFTIVYFAATMNSITICNLRMSIWLISVAVSFVLQKFPTQKQDVHHFKFVKFVCICIISLDTICSALLSFRPSLHPHIYDLKIATDFVHLVHILRACFMGENWAPITQ